MGDPDAGSAEPGDFVRVRHDDVSTPTAIRHPAAVLVVVDGPHAEGGDGVLVVLAVLGKVGVQADVEAFGEFGAADHEVLTHRERRAGGERNPDHRAVAAVVMAFHRPLGFGEDVVFVSHGVVGWEAAIALPHRHRRIGRVEAHAEIDCGLDLRAEQVARPNRVEIVVIRGGGAAGEREFGEPDPGGEVLGLLVDRCGPQRVERLQPSEERGARHRRVGAGEVLEQVVVGVDQARGDEAAAGVDDAFGIGHRVGRAPDAGDQPVGDRHPASGELATVVVDRGHEGSSMNQEVGANRQVSHRRGGWRSGSCRS